MSGSSVWGTEGRGRREAARDWRIRGREERLPLDAEADGQRVHGSVVSTYTVSMTVTLPHCRRHGVRGQPHHSQAGGHRLPLRHREDQQKQSLRPQEQTFTN